MFRALKHYVLEAHSYCFGLSDILVEAVKGITLEAKVDYLGTQDRQNGVRDSRKRGFEMLIP